MRTSVSRGILEGPNALTNATPLQATATPARPPIVASSTLSVINCRIRRPGAAPRAARTVNSRVRAIDRVSSRFAMLEQAISSTTATAPNNSSKGRRVSPASWRVNDRTRALNQPLPCGNSRSIRRAKASSSACARSALLAGVRRPTTASSLGSPRTRGPRDSANGTQSAVCFGSTKLPGMPTDCGNVKAAGMTPTMV